MKESRTCKECRKQYVAIKITQRFCSRLCFKKDYIRRKRAEKRLEEKRTKEYVYTCEVCGGRSPLPADPIKDQKSFTAHICPHCGIPRKVVWAHRYDSTFFFGSGTINYVVQSAIITFAQASTSR